MGRISLRRVTGVLWPDPHCIGLLPKCTVVRWGSRGEDGRGRRRGERWVLVGRILDLTWRRREWGGRRRRRDLNWSCSSSSFLFLKCSSFEQWVNGFVWDRSGCCRKNLCVFSDNVWNSVWKEKMTEGNPLTWISALSLSLYLFLSRWLIWERWWRSRQSEREPERSYNCRLQWLERKKS